MPVIVTRDFPPGRGGIQRYCSGLAFALFERSGDVCVVAPTQEGADSFDASLPYTVLRVEQRGRLATAVATAAAIRAAKKKVVDRRVIAAIWQPCGYEAFLAGSFGNTRPIIICHGSEITKQRHGVRKILASLVLRAGDAVAVSTFTARAVRSLGARARVVPVGVPQRPLNRLPSPRPQALIVGRLVRRKGFDRMIRALADLAADVPDLKLEIVGEGPDRSYLDDLVRELGVDSRVTFHGTVSDERLDELYASAWFFGMPNRTEAGYDVEGLGIVFLEAAMHGIPSIGGRESGAEDAIVDGVTGYLVDGNSQVAVTAAVRSLAGDSVRTKALGDAARERVLRDFDWDVIVERLLGTPPADAS